MAQAQTAIAQPAKPIRVGNLNVNRVIDCVEYFSPKILLKDVSYEHLEPYLDWLKPNFLDEKNKLILWIQSFIVKTDKHTILIDTCVGNDKHSGFPQWNMRQAGFLRDLTAAGFPPESIDYVFCTHLHVDHAGWNTKLENGRWVPTFPNAKYLFRKKEYEYWEQNTEEHLRWTFDESVLPVVQAGQVEWVPKDHQIDDQVVLEPTPGHTPGHTSIHLYAGDKDGVITGDMIVHPVEIAQPTWGQVADWDHALAVKTRSAFIDKYCDTDTLILGTHFADPTAVHIVGTPDGARIKF